MNYTTNSPISTPNPSSITSVPTSPSSFTPSRYITDGPVTGTSSCCNNLSEPEIHSQSGFPSPTSVTLISEATTALDDQFYMTKDGFDDYYEEHYTTPISILLLNFCLVMFLMVVIGIAVYPAMKKYCNSSFSFGDNYDNSSSSYWIEDTEEVSSSAGLMTPPQNDNESSIAFLNSTSRADVLPSSSSPDFNSACEIELLSEI